MKKLIYKKGILLKVTSWENDADYYRTKEYSVRTVEEAKALKRMCNILFKSEHSAPLAIANDCGASIGDYEDSIVSFMSKDEYFKNIDTKDMVGYVEDFSYELMGGSEHYNCRVCESCVIFEVKEDVYLNTIEL